MMMVRSTFKPVLSLCLIVVAGYGAYVPFEKIQSAQAEAASKPMVVNALLPELNSRAGESMTKAAASASLVLGEERAIDINKSYHTDLNDKTL